MDEIQVVSKPAILSCFWNIFKSLEGDSMLRDSEGISGYNLKLFEDARKCIMDKIERLDYPDNHPFLQWPNTPESRIVDTFSILLIGLGNQSKIIDDLLKKCRSVEKGKFNYYRYIENVDELLLLFYIYVRILKSGLKADLLYEPVGLMDNNKKLEYSFLMHEENYILNFEVKSMLCDPFYKEGNLPVEDGSLLLKKYINDQSDYEKVKEQYPEAIELTHSAYYSPFKKNITKIVEKYDGRKQMDCNMINIGVVCINFSTSMDEFYTCLYHKDKGFFKTLQWGNLDALVLFTLDAKNDIMMDNIYQMGYIQTVLLNEDMNIRKYFEKLQLDNYISIGKRVNKDVYETAQESYGLYQIFNREGFLNIVPYMSKEDELEGYLRYLKGEKVRYEV